MQILKRPQFLLDLAEELTWLQDKAGANVAESWFQSLTKTIGQLESNPFIGRERKDLSPPGIRSWRLEGFPRWLVFYRIDGNNNLVFYRVRQGSMNLVVLKIRS